VNLADGTAVVLVTGVSGSGKSAIARRLTAMGRDAISMDADEQLTGRHNTVSGRRTPRPHVHELGDICPTAQRTRCANAHTPPTAADLDRVLDQFGYESRHLIENDHVWTHGLGEQRRCAVQQTLGFQIWELD
jgi:hypothetical protein